MLSKKEPVMRELNESQKRDIRMYGVSEAELREWLESSITFRTSGPAMVVAGLMSDCQEMVSYGPYDSDTLANIMEDQRMTLNRAKWILFEYCMKETV
jgi:hypothetical protein